MTVRDDCDFSACNLPTPNSVYKQSHPLIVMGWGVVGLAFGQMSAIHPHQLPASEIKQTFFSTDLTCLEAFEWQAAGPHLTLSVTAGISK